MIPLKYPRSFEYEPGKIVTYTQEPAFGGGEITWTPYGVFDSRGNPIPDSYFRSQQFGEWDIPQDEIDRQRMHRELDAAQARLRDKYERELREIAKLRTAVATKKSMADREWAEMQA